MTLGQFATWSNPEPQPYVAGDLQNHSSDVAMSMFHHLSIEGNESIGEALQHDAHLNTQQDRIDIESVPDRNPGRTKPLSVCHGESGNQLPTS
jgi:hypothetical protein